MAINYSDLPLIEISMATKLSLNKMTIYLITYSNQCGDYISKRSTAKLNNVNLRQEISFLFGSF